MGRDRRSVCLSIPGEEGWGEIEGLSVCLSVYPRGRGVGRDRRPVCLSIPGEEGWGEIEGLSVCLSQGNRGGER